MAADEGPDPAMRLEAALDRIAHAAASAHLRPARAALPAAAAQATTPASAPDTAVIMSRLDALIADLRSVLGTQA